MTATVVAGLQLPDTGELRSLAAELTDAGGDISHHTGRISNAVFSAPGEVVAQAVRAAQAFARRWDTVGSALTGISTVADSAANALQTFARDQDAAEDAWRSAVSNASSQGFGLTAIGRSVELDSPALPANATASQTSDQQTLANTLRQAGQNALDDVYAARSRVLGMLRSIHLPALDNLTATSPVALPETGDPELDEEIAHLANPVLGVTTHFTGQRG